MKGRIVDDEEDAVTATVATAAATLFLEIVF